MSMSLNSLPQDYRLIFCDLWGCVHNGVSLLPGVLERLERWKLEGRRVIYLTNAPRPSSAVADQLSSLNLPDHLNGNIVSSGDTALSYIAQEGRERVFAFLGNDADASRLESAGLRFTSDEAADTVVCTGFDARGFDIQEYRSQLQSLSQRRVEMLCFNPDRVVRRGAMFEPCAGYLADIYESLGGVVRHFGKPYPQIYTHAFKHAEQITGQVLSSREVVAIGDSVATDFVGAANAGVDFIFITDGIDKADFAASGPKLFTAPLGLKVKDARPVAFIPGLK